MMNLVDKTYNFTIKETFCNGKGVRIYNNDYKIMNKKTGNLIVATREHPLNVMRCNLDDYDVSKIRVNKE